MTASDPAAKPFAWAGISVSIPLGWDTAALDHGYGLLESRSRPVLEFKTAAIRGRFSLRRQMRLLTRIGRQGDLRPIAWAPPPDDWPAFPATADVRTFRWQEARIGGRGLLYYCRLCQRATLLRFYEHRTPTADVPSVLASFKDHDFSARPRVAVYDVKATLPQGMTLQTFRFEAGRFELVFRRRGETVTLWRLSPADIILARRGQNLRAIARDNALLPAAVASVTGQPTGDGMEWRWRPNGYRYRIKTLFDPSGARPVHALRIWHLPRANRLLAVRAEGLKPNAAFERICDGYGIF